MAHQPEASYGADSPAVTTHLSIIQGVIGRMAGNSTSCKIQCVVLVTGVIILVAQTKTSDYALLGLLPTLLFLILDVYHLALERAFRRSYDTFVDKLRGGKVSLTDLYVVRPGAPVPAQMAVSLRSTSVWPFYLMLTVAVLLVWKFACVRELLGF